MWLSDRRGVLIGALALGACGFTPAYGPGGPALALQNTIHIDEPDSRESFVMTRRIEERLGAGGANAPYTMELKVTTTQDSLGTTSEGSITRYQLLGSATFALRRAGENSAVQTGTVRNFTGYSASGSTAATLASQRDAVDRLMLMLADQVIDRLVLASADLPPA